MTQASPSGRSHADSAPVAAPPLVSICLPTYNREALLDLCLTRLADLNRVDLDYEVVVSDNCSTDRTEAVVQAHRGVLRQVSFCRMKVNRGPLLNWHNAVRHARGTFVVYLGDDDRLIPEGLAAHCNVMQAREDLVATYADWIAYDEQAGREMHRYYPFLKARREFGPADRMQVMEFILSNSVLPETSILRRETLLRALPYVKNGYPFLQYLYQMVRQGTIAFDREPFYIEGRVVQAHLDRSNWQGMGLWLINDEMRTTLEMVVLKVFQDSGFATVPEEMKAQIRHMIDARVYGRLPLEAKFARANGNFIQASELHRRWMLWRGNLAPFDLQNEIDEVVVPAALQAIYETFETGSDFSQLAFHGFRTPAIPGAFARAYPSVPLEGSAERCRDALLRRDRRYLHVAKTAADLGGQPIDGHIVLLDNLLDLYSTTSFDLVLEEL